MSLNQKLQASLTIVLLVAVAVFFTYKKDAFTRDVQELFTNAGGTREEAEELSEQMRAWAATVRANPPGLKTTDDLGYGFQKFQREATGKEHPYSDKFQELSLYLGSQTQKIVGSTTRDLNPKIVEEYAAFMDRAADAIE